MIKINRETIVTCVLITIGLMVFGYFWAASSDAFKVAEEYVQLNKEIIDSIGPIENTYLSYFGRISSHASSSERLGSYPIEVVGTKGRGKAIVEVRLSSKGWEILSASFSTNDGRKLILKESKSLR